MKVAIIIIETLNIPCVYDAPEPQQGSYGGEWGSPQVTVHLEVPESLDPQCIMAVRSETGEVTLTTDTTKLAQKTADQWTQVRDQQRQKLYESDWTREPQVPVAALAAPAASRTTRSPTSPSGGSSAPDGAQPLVQYRAQLRDVTTQSDPFNIVWPVAPEA